MVVAVTVVHMSSMIKQHRQDQTIAFAHIISGDFHGNCHMTAGVAVVFAEHFGKPTASHCITDNLTLQNSPNGASVYYSLVTKAQHVIIFNAVSSERRLKQRQIAPRTMQTADGGTLATGVAYQCDAEP